MSGATLDAGALIAFERRDRGAQILVRRAIEQRYPLVTSAAVVAQVLRRPERQVLLTRLLNSEVMTVHALTRISAAAVGRLLERTQTSDVVDGHLALLALAAPDRVLLTSDPEDMHRLTGGRVPIRLVG